MRVILTEKVKTLGNVGEIVNVSEGYARNYLIPNRYGVLADDKNKKVLENQQKALAKKIEQEKADAQALKEKVQGITLEFSKRVGGTGKIFGSIGPSEISKELEKKEIHVERRLINVPSPIKTLGEFEVSAKIFEGVEADFKVKVEMDHNQIEEQKKAQAKAAERKKAKAANGADEETKTEAEVEADVAEAKTEAID